MLLFILFIIVSICYILEQFSIEYRNIRDRIGFVSKRTVICFRNSRHLYDQSDAKLKLVATWSFAFSRA